MSRTREERETIIRFDETDGLACISTFSVIQARRWQRAGVALTRRGDEWLGRVPKQAVRGCRKLVDGRLVARKTGSLSGTAQLAAFRRSKSAGRTRAGSEPDAA